MIDEKRNIALVEEEVTVGKQLTPGATVMVSVRADTQLRRLELPVTTEQISVDTVEIDREVTAVPEIRTEGEVTIIPVVEEEAVLMKRLILKREVRVTKKR